MPERKTIQDYLQAVGEQIRWKRARPVVLWELERHLDDQRDAFANQGREDPEGLAVAEMGDPVSVGAELDLLHRPRPQWGLLIFTVLFAAAGAFLRFWLTRDFPIFSAEKPAHVIIGFVLGCLALLCGYFLDVGRLGRYPWLVYLAALVVSVVSLACSPYHNGYYTRYMALCFPVVYALWLYGCRGKGWKGQALAILGGIPLAVVCMEIPHAFALLLLMAAGFVMLLLAAAWDWFGIGRWKSLPLPAAAAAGVLAAAIFHTRASGYLTARLEAAFHPEADPLGAGWVSMMTKKALEVSQWLGEGDLGGGSIESYEKMVPDCDKSSLLTTLIYRTGWLPFLLVTLALAVLVVWLLCRCVRQKSKLGRLVALAVGMTLLSEALCSVAWNLGFTLLAADFPLVIGNLHTVLVMGLIGLALSVFRGDSIARETQGRAVHLPRVRLRISLERN